MAKTIRTLTLTEAQRQELKDYRDHDLHSYMRERSAALLKIAEGKSPHWVARNGLLKPRDPDTVYAWLNVYEEQGVAGLLKRTPGQNRRGRLRQKRLDGSIASKSPEKG
jgi:transposase